MCKKILWMLFVVSFAFPFVPTVQAQNLLRATMPLPSWVKEGVCVVHAHQGGVQVGGDVDSSATLGGYTILLVTNIEKDRAYGIEYRIFGSSGKWSMHSSVKLLNTPMSFFYFPPEIAEQALREKEEYYNQGVIVEGGPVREGLFYFAMTRRGADEETVTSYEYTRDGIIKSSTFTRKSPRGMEIASLNLVGIYEVQLPFHLEAPQIAQQSVTYRVTYGAMGIWTPRGTLSIEPIGTEGRILRFQLTPTGQMSQTTEVLGTPIIGPFYIHPELLRESTIFAIPDIGFHIGVTGQGQRGGTLVTFSLNGQTLVESEYDSANGLLLSSTHNDFEFTVHLELQEENASTPESGEELAPLPFEEGMEEEVPLFSPWDQGTDWGENLPILPGYDNPEEMFIE